MCEFFGEHNQNALKGVVADLRLSQGDGQLLTGVRLHPRRGEAPNQVLCRCQLGSDLLRRSLRSSLLQNGLDTDAFPLLEKPFVVVADLDA